MITKEQPNFSKGYRILKGSGEHWYYSCCVVEGTAKRGFSLESAMWTPGMFAGARLREDPPCHKK